MLSVILALNMGFSVPMVAETSSYAQLASLFQDWRAFERPVTQGEVPDYSATAMAAKAAELATWRTRLESINLQGWPIEQLDDYGAGEGGNERGSILISACCVRGLVILRFRSACGQRAATAPLREAAGARWLIALLSSGTYIAFNFRPSMIVNWRLGMNWHPCTADGGSRESE